MKKIMLIVFLSLVILAVVGFASAETAIAGKIYNSDFSATVAGASVDVTCNSVTNSTLSLGDGTYVVNFDTSVCGDPSTVTVDAFKEGVGSGSATGTVHSGLISNLDLAIVNVPLIPEFGLLVGTLTAVSAIGIFFIVRKK
jgi:hypothetical protein